MDAQTKTVSVEVPVGLQTLSDGITQLITDIKTKQSLAKDVGDSISLIETAVANLAEIMADIKSPELLAVWGVMLAKQIFDSLTPVTTTNPPVPAPDAPPAPVAPATV